MILKRVLASAVAAAILGLVAAAVPAAAPAAMPADDKAAGGESAIGEKWAAAWNSHDADKMVAAFTSDIYYEDVAFASVNHGTEELRKFAQAEWDGVGDLQLKVVRSVIHGGHGTIEWTFSGTDKGVFNTGKKFSVRGVSVVDVRNGKISRCLDYYDVATIMKEVGALPAPK